MKVLIVGAGPAGLYLAYLLRRRDAGIRLRIVEQNPPDSTFGFGVVFSDRALEFLRNDDDATYALVTPRMQQWRDLTIHHRGERVTIDGVGFAAIGRLELLRLLQSRLTDVGVTPEYRHVVEDAGELEGYDLVVGADGLHSFVRRGQETRFGTSVEYLDNRFAWFGTTRRFETLSQTFVETAEGTFNAHHYRYSPTMSTFIVECDAGTWRRAGLDRMDDEASRDYCAEVFAPDLDGRPLVSNKSVWRSFPLLTNANWRSGNVVLIGDALRTGHFSVGSGTRLALEDAIALDKALAEAGEDVQQALARFEAQRRPVVEKIVAAARQSSYWYERLAGKMQLPPWQLAYDYMTRSGRMDDARLASIAPDFMARRPIAASR